MRVYREKSKRWEGLFRVEKMREEIWVNDGKMGKQFSRTMVLPDPNDSSDKELARLLEEFRQLKSGRVPGILLTDILQRSDPRYKEESFDSARAK